MTLRPPKLVARPWTSAVVTRSTKSKASLPVHLMLHMWLTSKSEALSRVHLVDSMMLRVWLPPAFLYSTGMEYPAKSTILPPSSTCWAWTKVFFSSAAAAASPRDHRAGVGLAADASDRATAPRADIIAAMRAIVWQAGGPCRQRPREEAKNA